MREREVEAHFVKRVRETGGEQRKVRWIGRRGAPDRLCWWPNGRHAFVELKRPDADARPEQAREHARMTRGGMKVLVLDTKEAVDLFIRDMTWELVSPGVLKEKI